MKPTDEFDHAHRRRIWYECICCGECCRWPGEVHVTEEDIERLAALLGMKPEDFINRFTELGYYRTGLVLKESPDGACIFLDGKLCRVYSARPFQCRSFPNLWHPPDFPSGCPAKVVEISEEEYRRRLASIFNVLPDNEQR